MARIHKPYPNRPLGDIAEGPLGRAVLARLMGVDIAGVPGPLWDAPSLATYAAEQSVTGNQFLAVFREIVDGYPMGTKKDWDAVDVWLIEHKRGLADWANEVLIQSSISWISDPFQRETQIGFSSQWAYVTGPHCQDNVTPGKGDFSRWWVAPDCRMFTFAELPATFSERSPILDDYWVAVPNEHLSPYEISSELKVREVLDRNDWVTLVEQFPEPTPKFLTYNWASGDRVLVWPDWKRLREHYDGVYLSPLAYLQLAYARIDLGPKSFTTLAGWHPGATIWLNEVVLKLSESPQGS